MKKLTNKHQRIKEIVLSKKDRVYVGLDVHKKSISVAVWINDHIELTFNCPPDHSALIEKMKTFASALKMISYEAGPTGYGLARAFQRASLPAQVISPSNTPRPSKRTSKTDGLDCRQLAEFSAKGLLKHVAIPSEEQEAIRQLPRLRDQLVRKRRRIRQQIKSFLLQHNIDEPQGLTRWSCQSVMDLEKLNLNASLRLTMDIYLEELAHLSNLIKRVETRLTALSEESSHRESLNILTSHPGVGPVVSWGFYTEMFAITRFQRAGEIASFLGLAPRIIQSGQSCRDGPITKTGREQLRSKLIEASWVWIQHDQQAGRVYNRLFRNTGNGNKAIVGMARRLAIHLWHMLCEKEYYHKSA